jgi:hypothetical protein
VNGRPLGVIAPGDERFNHKGTLSGEIRPHEKPLTPANAGAQIEESHAWILISR